MNILITNKQTKHEIELEKIRKIAQIILDAMEYSKAELSILIVDDPQIAELNQEYLNRKGPTNVISFPMYDADDLQSIREESEENPIPCLLGDVVISIETARKEGEQIGISREERFTQLLIHGILHLLGYDHEKTEPEALQMEAKEHELFKLVADEG